MKKRFLCMFCALCLALSLLSPVTVQAAATTSSAVQEVKIGSATLNADKPYYHNGADGAQGTADNTAASANASFDADTGTLTLNGLNIVTDKVGIWWTYSYQGAHDLKIVLDNGTTNTVNSSANYAIEGNSGYSGDGPSLIIEGSGTLNVTGSQHGIWVWHDVTVQDNVTVNATGETGYGICNNDSAGTITIKDTVNVAATGGTYGIGYDNSDAKANIPVIQGGTVAVSGGTAAVRVKAGSIEHALDLTGYAGGCIVTVGDNAASSTEWDIRNSLADYKYIKIQSGLHTHSWAADWSKNETSHWHNCLKPGCNVTANNTKDSYGEHVYTDDADTDCNICGYYRTLAPPSNPDITEIPEAPVNGKGLGISIIADPTAPKDTADAWKGSYVYFGTSYGVPDQYRVLDRNTTDFGGTTMLLDCSFLWTGNRSKFDDSSNAWADSYIKKYLNSEAGYSDTGILTSNFTDLEQKAIAESKTQSRSENYVPLTGEKIFLLDAEDLLNESYGYSNANGSAACRVKTGSPWWLRSASVSSQGQVGIVSSDGSFGTSSVSSNIVGVSPALNVKLSSIIFSSVVQDSNDNAGTSYKLTLHDRDMTVAVNGTLTRNSSDVVTVPYIITGNNAANATQVSLMVLDKEYTEGNTNGAKLIDYHIISDVVRSGIAGTGMFILSDDMKNDSYYFYIVAEDVNGSKLTDYASTPVQLIIPEAPPQKDNVTVNDETEDGEEDESSSSSSNTVIPSKPALDSIQTSEKPGKWVKDNIGWWFSFTDKSYPVSRWLKVTEKWYYFNAAGYMATGWQKVDGRWYYLDPVNGDMTEGWKLLNGKWYYLNPVSGDMAEGWKAVNGKWYYLVPSSGECLMDTTTPDGYKVDKNGAWIQ